jgi:hypothetical protein
MPPVGPGWRFAGPAGSQPSWWIGGHLPWPVRVADPENIAPDPEVCETTPRIVALDVDNLVRSGLRAEAALRRARGGPWPFWLDGLDLMVEPRGHRAHPFTYRHLFQMLRGRGVKPHPGSPADDGSVAAALLNAILAAAPASDGTEATIEPDDRLVMDEGHYPRLSAVTIRIRWTTRTAPSGCGGTRSSWLRRWRRAGSAAYGA